MKPPNKGVDRDVSNGYFSSPNFRTMDGLHLSDLLAKRFPWKPPNKSIDKSIYYITQANIRPYY